MNERRGGMNEGGRDCVWRRVVGAGGKNDSACTVLLSAMVMDGDTGKPPLVKKTLGGIRYAQRFCKSHVSHIPGIPMWATVWKGEWVAEERSALNPREGIFRGICNVGVARV